MCVKKIQSAAPVGKKKGKMPQERACTGRCKHKFKGLLFNSSPFSISPPVKECGWQPPAASFPTLKNLNSIHYPPHRDSLPQSVFLTTVSRLLRHQRAQKSSCCLFYGHRTCSSHLAWLSGPTSSIETFLVNRAVILKQASKLLL